MAAHHYYREVVVIVLGRILPVLLGLPGLGVLVIRHPARGTGCLVLGSSFPLISTCQCVRVCVLLRQLQVEVELESESLQLELEL